MRRFLLVTVIGVGTLFAAIVTVQNRKGDSGSQSSGSVVDALREYGQSLVANSRWPIVYDHDRLIILNGGGYTLSFHIETDGQANESSSAEIEGFYDLTYEEKRSRWLAEICTTELDAIIGKYQQQNIGLLISPGAAGGPNIVAYASSCAFD